MKNKEITRPVVWMGQHREVPTATCSTAQPFARQGPTAWALAALECHAGPFHLGFLPPFYFFPAPQVCT